MPELTGAQRRQLADLKRDYEAGLEAAVAKVVESATSLADDGYRRSGLHALRQLAHRLVGSSAIWGFSTLSAVAARLEDLAIRAAEAPRMPEGEFARQATRLTRQLWQAVPARLRSRPVFTTEQTVLPPVRRPAPQRAARRVAQPRRAGSQRNPRLTMRCKSSS